MESLWLLIVLFFILILVFPENFKIYLSYSPLENNGLFVVKLWNVTLEKINFQIKSSGLVVRTKKERKQVEYKFTDPKLKYYENVSMELRQKVKLKYIDAYSKVGTGNASESALYSGILNIILKIMGSYIKNLKPSGTVIVNTQTDFNEKVFDFSIYCKLSISLFDVIYSFFVPLLKKQK